MLIYLLLGYTLSAFPVVQCCTVHLEAEDGSTTGAQMYRSKASGGITALLKEGDYIRYQLTTYSDCVFSIQNVAYSNDGTADTITLALNSTLAGSFMSMGQTGDGDLWNVIRSSGPVGNPVGITAGYHTLTLEAVSTDDHGVEIDALTLAFACADIDSTSTSEDCPESEVKFTGTESGSPDSDGGGGGGLSTEARIAIGFGVVGTVLAVPGCIAAVCAIHRYIDGDTERL